MKAGPCSARARCLALLLLLAAPLLPAARATTVVPPEFEQLVTGSDYVVRAVVESTRSEFRDTPQGRLIVTFVKVRVQENIVGEPPVVMELEMLGGRIGDRELRIAGAPLFAPGDDDILFISGNSRTFYPLYALMHGRYPVRRDAKTGREFVTRSNAVPLQSVREVSLPMTTGSLATLQQRAINPADALSPRDFISSIKTVAREAELHER
jgi:hypothetical protein